MSLMIAEPIMSKYLVNVRGELAWFIYMVNHE